MSTDRDFVSTRITLGESIVKQGIALQQEDLSTKQMLIAMELITTCMESLSEAFKRSVGDAG